MWIEAVSHWLVATAVLCQAAPDTRPAMPEPVTMRQQVFAIPIQLRKVDNPARQPVELQLYVSTDRGLHWRLYAKVPASQQHFIFRAGGDGEYWFAVRTIDRSGLARPMTVAAPDLRVVVAASTKPQSPPSPKNSSQPKTQQSAKVASESDAAAAKSAGSTEQTEPAEKGSVAIAINPAIGKNYGSAGDAGRKADEAAVPPGLRPRMVNSRMFELEYDVDSIGPSGIGRVELWGTRDSGQTWRRFATDNDTHSPLVVNVEDEGVYGFRVLVTNGAGLGGKPPVSGDQPDLWVGVDLSKPTARIVSAQQGVDAEAGNLIISWQADDRMLADRPVSLSFSAARGGPWLPIASGLENTGRYAWPIDARTPPEFYLRLEVRDEAGNLAVNETAEPATVDQSRPTVRVRNVRPVSQTGVRPTQQW